MDDVADPVTTCESLLASIRETAPTLSDRELSDTILARLAEARLLWPAAPVAGQPLAPTLRSAARMTYRIAELSGSAALSYAMHLSQALTLERHATDTPYLAAQLERFRAEQSLIASGTSEKGVGGDIFGTRCTIDRGDPDRYTLVKESPNISYLAQAAAAVLVDAEERRSQVLILARQDDVEATSGRVAEFMGMKGIDNRPFALQLRFRPEAILTEKFPAIARATMTPVIHILWAALWSGLASHALSLCKRVVGGMSADEKAIRAVVSFQLSALIDRHYTLNALIRDAIRDVDEPHDAMVAGMNWSANVKRLKTVGSDTATDICLGALEIVGMPGYAEAGPLSLSTVIRDVLSSKVMISNYRLIDSNAATERYLTQDI
ncbi:acyl-CoA dehydrogenase [Sphingomonas ginkgonis]|uniref:Acyl-CoA dehydrogenase n=1 Tax=Sphingomonas ginkgonis TaxID=2315330 RepID=A0A429VDR0_9SPHN|nr:acyl-CoA/acyl-ACP dehydrogenase [Sphingomonas ginkgonis]RST31997.1 acyl-CoA dehydrogenase [Sphingomonas ginkgonis]